MTRAHFLAVALALGMALARPSTPAPDRYEDGSRRPDEATDPSAGDQERQKRAYAAAWTGTEDFTKWKPPLEQLARPYFIPVYGAQGIPPIFFPPQRLNLNPGTPVDNPLPHRPFEGPQYLPPATEKTTTTTMKFMNRFNDDDDDDDDRPIWSGSQQGSGSEIVPTRPPRPPGMADFPPLVHDVSQGDTNALAAETVAEQGAAFARMTTPVSVTTGPSNCVWAIVSCCSASTSAVPDSCFEQRGCPGPFWGPSSPCDSDYAKAAINLALNYYRT